MRYYELTLIGADGTSIVWSSFPSDNYNSAALNIIFDVPVSAFHLPIGGSVITIEGIDPNYLKQYNNFAGYEVSLVGGMKEGLPLSKNQPAPALLFRGTVQEGFGNWIGTQISLNLFVTASKYNYDNPGNFVLSWAKNSNLSDALAQCAKIVYPGMPQNIIISDQLVAPHDENGIYYSLSGLATAVNEMTKGKFLGSSYPGVSLSIQNGTFMAWDNTQSNKMITIQYTDMLGQPAWVGSQTLYVMTAMRSDISVGNIVNLPKNIPNLAGFVTTVPSLENSYQNYDSLFNGDFYVKELRHIGNFRSDSGEDWATVIKCVSSQ